MIAALEHQIRAAISNRAPLLERLAHEDTDCWRLFHGIAEGRPGLTMDRYGEYCLVQTFREPLEPDELAAIERAAPRPIVWRHRGRDAPSGQAGTQPGTAAPDWARAPQPFRELGVSHSAPPIHRGADPWLFLDLRAGRRWIRDHAAGKRVLNTFSYTGGAGLVAAKNGATSVTQLDHGGWCLAAGDSLAARNGVEVESLRADFFVALRQFAGLPIRGRAARGGYPRFAPRTLDLIVLDPPTFTRGPFGAVDIVRDYASLAKPCLLCLAAGGTLLATNHSPAVGREDWIASVVRCGEKAGRPVQHVERIEPDGDFPSFDGAPPLSVAAFTV